MTAPKPPSPKKVNPYEGMTSDPEFAKAAAALGYTKVNKDSEVRAVKEYLYKQTLQREREDKTFKKAEKQLRKEGLIDKEDRMSEWYINKVYDRQTSNAAKKEQKQYQKQLQAQSDEFVAAQQEQAEAQKKLMEEMMNQPIYSAKQAALPPVQYKAPTPEPMPVAPAPPPAMNISPTPPPTLTNVGNQMSIVRQNSTTKARQSRRTRGTSSLTN